jgi:uncharacterized protein YpmS
MMQELLRQVIEFEESIVERMLEHFQIPKEDIPFRVFIADSGVTKSYRVDGVPALILFREMKLDEGKIIYNYKELYLG